MYTSIQILKKSGSFVDSQRCVGGHEGVNVAITGMTGGAINLLVGVAGEQVVMPNLVFTEDGLYRVGSASGCNLSIEYASVTGDTTVEVKPVG